MEKYKYCNIGPTSSPRVGGKEGGWQDREGKACVKASYVKRGYFGKNVFERTESKTRVYVYMYI